MADVLGINNSPDRFSYMYFSITYQYLVP